MSKFEKKSILIDMRSEKSAIVAHVYAQAMSEQDLNSALQILNECLKAPFNSETKNAREY